MNYILAFVVGGLICVAVQILMDNTKLLPGRIMVILVCLGKWAGAGATVPLLGFGNTLWKGMKEAIDKEGFIGLFKGGFTACSVGVSAALIFGYAASLIFKPKMKLYELF